MLTAKLRPAAALLAAAAGLAFAANADAAHRPGGLTVATDSSIEAAPANQTIVYARPTGDLRLDHYCGEWAVKINQSYAANNPTAAKSMQHAAEGKGCRYLTLQHVAIAPQPTTVSAG